MSYIYIAKQSLSQKDVEELVVTTRLDYCNSLL